MLFLQNIVSQIWFHFLSKKGVAFTGAHESSFIATDAMQMQRDVNLGETPSTKPKREVVNRKLLPVEETEKEQDISDSEFSIAFMILARAKALYRLWLVVEIHLELYLNVLSNLYPFVNHPAKR